MSITLAFDVYGTLIDTQDIASKLEVIVGPKAKAFSELWRSKQLEYSFRRGLMRQYQSFAVCTAQALDYCCLHYSILLSENQKQALLDAYSVLPAFSEVKASLRVLADANIRLYAFSNGSKKAVQLLLENARIEKYFNDIISVEDVSSFKPDPDVYQHLLSKTAASKSSTYLVSSNAFDVLGAMNAGLKTAWLKRSQQAVFDPWGVEPTMTIQSLEELSLSFKGS